MMATRWLRRTARSVTWWQAGVVVVAAAMATMVAARPAGALDDEPSEPPPVLGCLTKVQGAMWAWPTQVMDGQSTKVSWSVTVPSTCTGVTVRVTGPGLYATARSGAQAVVPIPAANGYATYQVQALRNAQQLPLANLAIKVNPVSWTAYGRTYVRIDWNRQVNDFVRAIATPNTTVLLADDLNLDLTGRGTLHILPGVHMLGGRSSTTPGPRVFTTAIRTAGPEPLFAIGDHFEFENLPEPERRPADNVRIIGVRIDGGDMGIAGNGILEDNDPVRPVGIMVFSSVNVEIAHCEISGWSGIGIRVLDPRDRLSLENASAVWIHDNYIHHNRRYRREGYGVATGPGAYALIERNVFNYNRHALESSGDDGTGYRAYSNLLLSGGGDNSLVTYTHQFDVHGTASCGGYGAYCGDAGEYFDYRYNTLFYQNGDVIKVRGRPDIGADVTQNMFAKGEGSSAISQTEGDNLVAWQNTFQALESYQALACDFDGNGELDDFMATGATWWYRSAATGHQFYYLHTSTTMVEALAFGDVNGDGLCDVTMPADGMVFYGARVAGAGATVRLVAAPKRTDLVWAPPYTGWGTGGQGHLWRMHPLGHSVADEAPVSLIMETTQGEAGDVSPTAQVLGTGDFNGDGAPDLLWRDLFFAWVTLLDGSSASTSGNIVVPGHLVRSAGAFSGVSENRGVPPAGQLAGIGDFNADGRADLLWRPADGTLEIWFAGEQGNRVKPSWSNVLPPREEPVALDWQVKGVADFNGDGYSDILWFSDAAQKVAIWYMAHSVHIGDGYPGGELVAAGWQIQGVGDFDADGAADILWRHAEGNLVIWFRGRYQDGQAAPTWQNRPGHVIGPDWQVEGLGDFNADGRADIVWRHTDGTVSIWTMNGGWYSGESALLPMDPAWQLRGLLPQTPHRLALQ